MTTSLTQVRGRRAAVLTTGLVLGLVTGTAGPASAAPAAVSRGGFVLAPAVTGTAVSGRAQLVRVPSGRTILTVHLAGLVPGHTYGVHLHNDTCAAAAGHYKHDAAGAATPPNELWASSQQANPQAGITANAAGRASGNGVAPWIARSTAGSVVLHADAQHGGTPAGGPRLACADLA
jgi:hypothetical protein